MCEYELCWFAAYCADDLQAKGPTAYPNNAAFVAEYTCGLLATSFPNMTPTQIQAAVAGMMAIEDKRAFKHHMRDFLIQVALQCWCGLHCIFQLHDRFVRIITYAVSLGIVLRSSKQAKSVCCWQASATCTSTELVRGVQHSCFCLLVRLPDVCASAL